LANRIDELVAVAARSLAERRTRRDVLERFGALGAGVSLLGFRPLVDMFTAEGRAPRRSWHAGAFGQDEVAVCYEPLQVLEAEPGHHGLVVRKGPSFDAPPAPMNDGGLALVPVGTHFARQSARRAPGPGCLAPPPRPAVNGFVWGYPADDVRTNKSGWVPLEVDGVRYLGDDPGYGTNPGDPEEFVCGPNSKDFDCRSEASKAYCGYVCGGGHLAGFRYVGKLRHVLPTGLGEPRDSGEEYYMRWAASSTAFCYLAPGDVVFELGRKPGLSYGPHTVPWSFIEVRRGAFTPAGTRGWCLHDAFIPASKRLLAPHLRK